VGPIYVFLFSVVVVVLKGAELGRPAEKDVFFFSREK
jgi:hypothetical protein